MAALEVAARSSRVRQPERDPRSAALGPEDGELLELAPREGAPNQEATEVRLDRRRHELPSG